MLPIAVKLTIFFKTDFFFNLKVVPLTYKFAYDSPSVLSQADQTPYRYEMIINELLAGGNKEAHEWFKYLLIKK